MKEDILEQIVEDWFVTRPGWFAKHNIKYRPDQKHPDYLSKKDCVHSDIDILAISGKEMEGCDRVAVVSCKSWQGGFDPEHWRKVIEGQADYNEPTKEFKHRESWKSFRELISDKWIDAFLDMIETESGQRDLTYYIAVTRLKNTNRRCIESSEVLRARFQNKQSNIKLKIITLREMIDSMYNRIAKKSTPALEVTDIGRILQLIAAAGLKLNAPD